MKSKTPGYQSKSVKITTTVPQGVADRLRELATLKGTTVAEEARKKLVYSTGQYVV